LSALQREVQITNQRGLHARASAKFVNLASGLDATVEVEKDGNKVCGTSIMGLMMLGAAKGDTVELAVSGEDAEARLGALVAIRAVAAATVPVNVPSAMRRATSCQGAVAKPINATARETVLMLPPPACE